MKSLILIALLNVLSLRAFCQISCALQIDNSKTLYLCRQNSISVVAELCDPGELFFTADNGKIDTSGSNGHFYIWPNRTGPATIYVCRKKKGQSAQIIDSVHYVVKMAPGGQASLAGISNGKVSCARIRASISIEGSRWDMCSNYGVRNFTILVYRNDVEIFRSHCGARFSEATNRFLQRVKPGDRLVFTNICMKSCSNECERLLPFEITAN